MSDKMVPEKDLIAVKQISKDKEKRWDAERVQLTNQVKQLQDEVKIAKASGTDSEEIEIVKKHLLDQAEALKNDRVKYDEDLNSHKKREREFRAKELASSLKAKGVEITSESLQDEEDMDGKAKDLLVDFLAKENENLKKSPSSQESVFESGSGGVLKVMPRDMTKDQFDAFETKLKQTALSRK